MSNPEPSGFIRRVERYVQRFPLWLRVLLTIWLILLTGALPFTVAVLSASKWGETTAIIFWLIVLFTLLASPVIIGIALKLKEVLVSTHQRRAYVVISWLLIGASVAAVLNPFGSLEGIIFSKLIKPLRAGYGNYCVVCGENSTTLVSYEMGVNREYCSEHARAAPSKITRTTVVYQHGGGTSEDWSDIRHKGILVGIGIAVLYTFWTILLCNLSVGRARFAMALSFASLVVLLALSKCFP